jgi:long-chain acyl-CoA synthetase
MNIFSDLEKYSSNPAIITEDLEQFSYEEILHDADDIGKEAPGRPLVFVVTKNCVESLAGYIGLIRRGAVVALVNHTIHETLFLNLIDKFKPRFIYQPSGFLNHIDNWREVYRFRSYALLQSGQDFDYKIDENTSLLLSTSGSTGSPEVVRLTDRNILSNTSSIADYLHISSKDKAITTMPMSYSYGLSIINSHLYMGASVILTEASVMNRRFWSLLNECAVTTFGGVPYIYEMLSKLKFAQMNVPSIEYITQAGGKLNQTLLKEFSQISKDKSIQFIAMYGQTEATARMSYLPYDKLSTKLGSIGIAIPGGDFWLEDENGGQIQATDIPGELVYRGDNVSLGYAKDYCDLEKGDVNKGILKTGDVALKDQDGYYYIVGRKKRFLKLFGNRINLDELEQKIRNIGHECACGGTDENLKIFSTDPEADRQIEKYLIELLHINKTGFSIVNIEIIPRNHSGKILYAQLEGL